MVHYRILMENRSGSAQVIVWSAWLAAIVALAANPFRWEVNYFRIHGGQAYFAAIVGLLLLLIPACIFYVRWRRRGWYRYELPVVTGVAIILTGIEQPRALGVALLLFAGCLAGGLRLARLLGVAFTGAAETIGLGFALGSAALIPLLFILGLLHGYYWPVFLLLLLAPIAICWRDAMVGLRAIGRLWQVAANSDSFQHPLLGICMMFLAAGVLCGTMAALSPTLVLDAIKMHLPSSEFYVATHALQPVLQLNYSYFPQGFEVLMAAAYALGGQPAAQLVAPIFLLGFLLVLFQIAKFCGFNSAGILCGLASILVTPFLLWGGTQVKNDTELAFFQLASLYCCLRWRDSAERKWLMIGAMFLASSFSIKHVAAFGAVPLTLLFIAPLYRRPRAVRTAALFVLCVAVSGFYWHARTFILKGDPLYPRTAEEVVAPKFKMSRAARLRMRLEGPWLLQFADERIGFESPLHSPMGIMLLTFAPVALLIPRTRDPRRTTCWFFIGLYVLLWASRLTVLRYAVAPIALMIVFVIAKAVEAYNQGWAAAPGWMRLSIATAFAATLAYGLLGSVLIELVPKQFQMLTHRISAADYLRSNLPGYAPLEAIGKLDPNASVLIAKGCTRAYAPAPATSVCSSGGPKHGGLPHVREILNGNAFQFAVIPADWEADDRNVVFNGWNEEDVYSDDDWLVVRLTRHR